MKAQKSLQCTLYQLGGISFVLFSLTWLISLLLLLTAIVTICKKRAYGWRAQQALEGQ